MQNIKITNLLAFLLLFMTVNQVNAQNWFQYSAPPREFDWQLFSPEIHCDGEQSAAQGYFGSFDRAYTWLVRPERAPVGINNPNQNIRVFTPANVSYIYAAVTDGQNETIPVGSTSLLLPGVDGGSFGFQQNTADDAYSETGMGWGNRAEFGWVSGRNGWFVSILDSSAENTSFYGIDDKRLDQLGAAQGNSGIDGTNDPDGVGVFPPTGATAGIQAIPYVDGLYTVGVNFLDPLNLLLGYVDLDGDLIADDLDGDGVITPGIPGQNGFTDDFLNGGVGDRVRIGVVFDDMTIYNRTKFHSYEVSAIRRKRPLGAGTFAEMYLGARFMEVDDLFRVSARGGTLGDSAWDNIALNRLVGPQIGFRVSKSSSRWTTSIQGRFMAAANFTTIRQNGFLGDHLARTGLAGTNLQPGLPTSLGGNAFFHRYSEAFFSPTGELRIESAMQLTKRLSFNVGWTGSVAGNVTRAANTVLYELPTMGINPSNDALMSSMVTMGVELNR